MFNLSPALPQNTPQNIRVYTFTALIAMLVTALTATPALASGGGGGGFSGGGSASAPTPRVVDEVYEYGKAIYLGRSPGTEKINYCLKVDGEVKKLRGRTLRSWRGRKQSDFANALYDCKQPENLALRGVEQEQIAYVLYYLNKRYKLDLAGASRT